MSVCRRSHGRVGDDDPGHSGLKEGRKRERGTCTRQQPLKEEGNEMRDHAGREGRECRGNIMGQKRDKDGKKVNGGKVMPVKELLIAGTEIMKIVLTINEVSNTGENFDLDFLMASHGCLKHLCSRSSSWIM